MSKTIVMIHGMFGSSWCWDWFKPYFENKGYKCHTPILRHHDISPLENPPKELGTTSLNDYVNDLEKYILKLDEKPILIGHSMGGLLVQLLAAKGLGTKAVMFTPASPSGINALSWSVFKCFSRFFTTWAFWRKPYRISYKLAVYAFLHLMPEQEQKQAYNLLVPESGRAAAEIGLWMFDKNNASKVDETKIHCPMLITSASKDRIVPASVVKKVYKKYIRNAEYKEFENHSHWLIGEQGWEDVADYVAKWLDKKS